MIHIRRSEYEQLLSQQEELRTIIRQLREEIELLKNGRNSKTSSTALSQDISRSNAHGLRKSRGKPFGGQKGHWGHTLSMSSTPDTIYISMSRRIIMPRREPFEMSKSKRKSPVSSAILKEKGLNDLQGFVRLLILLSKMSKMFSLL
jgi:hypothetical protein